MNIKKYFVVLVAVLLFQSSAAMAGGNSIELTDDSAAVGGQVTIDIVWADSGSPTQTLQFDMLYDDSAFTFSSCPLNNPGNWVLPTCQVIGPGEIRLGLLDPDGLQDITVGSLILDVNGPPGMYQVTIEGGSIVTSDGESTTTDPALLEVLGASYDSTPAAPGPFNFGSLTMGVDPNGELAFAVGNDGEVGTTLNGSCSITGPGASAFSQTPDNTFSVMQGAGDDASVIVCDSSSAVGNYTATLSCTHDGDSNPASPPK